MDGNIGVMTNGAGYTNATNDLIKFHGGSAANFMDLSGNALHDIIRWKTEILKINYSRVNDGRS